MAEMKMVRKGRVVVRIAPEREGPVFVSVPSKAMAKQLASEFMGVSEIGETLGAALRELASDAGDGEAVDTTAPAKP